MTRGCVVRAPKRENAVGMAGVRPSLGAAILALPLLLTSCGGAEPDSASAQPPVPQVTDCNLGGKPRFSVGYRAHRSTSPSTGLPIWQEPDRREGVPLGLRGSVGEAEAGFV